MQNYVRSEVELNCSEQGGGVKSSQAYFVEYVEDDFVPTTQLWTIAADRSRIRILQLALRKYFIFVHENTPVFQGAGRQPRHASSNTSIQSLRDTANTMTALESDMSNINETATITVANQEEAMNLFGKSDEHVKFIEKETGVHVSHRSGVLTITGKGAAGIGEMIGNLLEQVRKGMQVEKSDIRYSLMLLQEEGAGKKVEADIKLTNGLGRPIRPRTPKQREYINALARSNMVFSVGPAGTGKTYLAVAVAVKKLIEESVKRIIICRPAVEAGEKLGFLPGDLQQKVDPYLRPIYDALFNMMSIDKCARYLDRGIIEVAPLAFMRGRTLDDAFVLMDEAQNTTVNQMKMFLTRLGSNSSAAVTGDVTQVDLPPETPSGLIDAVGRLEGLRGIDFVFLTKKDVVRHELVARIIEAYDDDDSKG